MENKQEHYSKLGEAKDNSKIDRNMFIYCGVLSIIFLILGLVFESIIAFGLFGFFAFVTIIFDIDLRYWQLVRLIKEENKQSGDENES